MQIEANVFKIDYDYLDNIESEIKKGSRFQIVAYEGEDEDDEGNEIETIGICIENTFKDKIPATIFIDLECDKALFFAKGIIAMIEAKQLNKK